MKKSFTLIVAVAISVSLLAQSSKKISASLMAHRSFISMLMQNQLSYNNKYKSALHMESLEGQSTRDTNSSLTDSVLLKYGAIDTAMYDYNVMIYPYNYPYATTPMFNDNKGLFTNPRVWFKTMYHWTIDPNTLTYGFYERDGRGYDVSKNLTIDTALYADSSLIPNMNYSNKFNTSNQITTGYSFVYQNGISDSLYKQYYSYSGGKLMEDSIYQLVNTTWYIISKTYYTYDVSNNLIQIDNWANPSDSTHTKPLVEYYKYNNTYDASHRLLTIFEQQNDGANLRPYVTDTFQYTGAYVYHTWWREYQYDLINSYWAPVSFMTKHVMGSGKPDTINQQSFDSIANNWVPYYRFILKYDTLQNPDTLYEYDYNYVSFPSKADYTTKYYYNYLTDPNSVNNIVASSGIKLYPNPNSGSFTLQLSGVRGQASVEIYNSLGQKVYLASLNPTKGGTSTTSLSLPFGDGHVGAGIYLYRVTDETGNIIGQGKFIVE